MAMIRFIGDKVLHRVLPPVNFSNQADVAALPGMLDVMLHNLHETGGVGIAANQCAEIENPKQIVVVGTSDPVAREKAAQRYPNQEIPTETVMINPHIIANGGDAYFPELGEGCLSVKGSLRAKVQRFTQTEIEYYDVDGNKQHKTYRGFIAHIIQHECDHLHGIVYLQKIIDELTTEQLNLFNALLEEALQIDSAKKGEFTSMPVLTFYREHKRLLFKSDLLLQELCKMDRVVLLGIKSVVISE